MSSEPEHKPPHPLTTQTVYVGLGSNIDNRREMFRRALEMMDNIPDTKVTALSPLYYTDPIDCPGGGEFLNGVARLQTKLEPLEFWKSLAEVEIKLERKDKGKSRPRTIDLDVLLYGCLEFNSPSLVIPHPRIAGRAFVLRPLFDLAPDAVVPPDNLTVAELWQPAANKSGVRPAEDIEITEILPHRDTYEGRLS